MKFPTGGNSPRKSIRLRADEIPAPTVIVRMLKDKNAVLNTVFLRPTFGRAFFNKKNKEFIL